MIEAFMIAGLFGVIYYVVSRFIRNDSVTAIISLILVSPVMYYFMGARAIDIVAFLIVLAIAKYYKDKYEQCKRK